MGPTTNSEKFALKPQASGTNLAEPDASPTATGWCCPDVYRHLVGLCIAFYDIVDSFPGRSLTGITTPNLSIAFGRGLVTLLRVLDGAYKSA